MNAEVTIAKGKMEREIKNNIIDSFYKELQVKLSDHLKRIMLFGSRARGDETLESDYDCLVVVDEASSKIKEIIDEAAGNMLFKYNAVFSAFPFTEKELQAKKYSPFLINIEKEGIIYDRR